MVIPLPAVSRCASRVVRRPDPLRHNFAPQREASRTAEVLSRRRRPPILCVTTSGSATNEFILTNLRSHFLFSKMSTEQLLKMVQYMERLSLQRGDPLVRQASEPPATRRRPSPAAASSP